MKTKKCQGLCAQVLPDDNFNKNASKKDGLDTECRKCKNSRDRFYFNKNPQKHRDRNRSWRVYNPAKEKARGERSKAVREERLKNAKGGKFDIGRADYTMRLLRFGFMCAYCHVNPAEAYDHAIPVAKGGSNFASNIYPACRRCNLEKGAKILWKEYIPIYARGFNVAASLNGRYKVHIKPVW